MYVFAFDRDWTVDVNPHPNHDAVPLEWVQHLAHDTEHAVYAIGNQELAEEAAIPGVVDIVGMHSDDWDDWLSDKQSDGRYERFPKRRERLSLIEDLHPDAEAYVVVDDIDLSDVDGWQHYHAWEFVPAVERGDFDQSLPWVDAEEDGSLEGAAASLVSPDAKSLADFLSSHEDATGFELTSSTDGARQTRLVHEASLNEHSIRRPSAAPVLDCTPVDPCHDSFRVRVDDVDRLSVADPPMQSYLPEEGSGRDETRGLRRLAEAKAESVPVMRTIARFDNATASGQRRDTLQVLRHVAASRPADCTPAVPALREALQSDDPAAPKDALTVLRHIAADDPGAVATSIDAVISYLNAERDRVQAEAAHIVSLVAHDDAEDVYTAVDSLERIIRNQEVGLRHACYAFAAISRTDPLAAASFRGQLGDVVADDDHSSSIRSNATAVLGRLIEANPSYGVPLVDDVAELLDASDTKLRNNAVAFLLDVAKHHSYVVEPRLDTLARLARVDDEFTRVNATGAIARLAEDDPDAVTGKLPVFIKRVSDENPHVRENACYVLGYVAPSFVTPALETRATEDGNPQVRSRAVWALDQLDANDLEVESEGST